MASTFEVLLLAQLNFLQYPPLAVADAPSTVTSLGNNGWTSLVLDTTVSDNYGMHSNVTNNTRLTAVVAGKYLVSGGGAAVANSSGSRGARLAKNGTAVQGSQQMIAAFAAIPAAVCAVPLEIQMAVGDYVEVQMFQNSGGSLNTSAGTDGSGPMLSAKWVSF